MSAVIDFDRILALLVQHEGGFVNDPRDRGGPTKYGITLRAFSVYLGRPATLADVEHIDLATAKDFYLTMFWFAYRFNELKSPAVALVMFDQSVLCGPGSTIRKLQTALGFTKPDGVMGNVTLAAANKADGLSLSFDILRQSARNFLVVPKSQYIAGWIDRLLSLANEIAELEH